MATDEKKSTRDRITTALRAFEQRDAVAAASEFAEDGVFIDPQYPDPEYRGRERIRKAFEWALTNLVEQPAFTVRTAVGDDSTWTMEVDTHHARPDGSQREFPQVFVVDGGPAGITRWRTYLPFPPER